ncbi:hypothetical protein BB561_000672 [Smittium simulii]|uniref:Uncharacterized protein n=1 Tax=Smittium simulii TaxID=133385 RepID=A0A2T9YY71_9FUNG|nr:hypothetical protein BB561_000672 [Smittium simulii]
MTNRKYPNIQISKWIAATEAVYPELKTHIKYVLKIRNGTYWTAQRYAKSGFIEKRFIEECPFCRNIAPETIEHMILECSRWQALRADILAQYINIYRAQVATKPPLLSASISMRLVGKLLGEELKLSSTRICKDPTVLCVKTTLATAKFLNAIALSRYLMFNTQRYAKSGFIEKRFIEECPFCRNIAPETIEHMILECSRWQALRADILAQYINIYRAQVATKPPLLSASISMRLVGKLLGEELKLSSTRICKDPTVLCVKTTLATAKFLNAIALSRYLMFNSIRLASIPTNQCPPVSGVIPGAATGMPYRSAKRTRLEYIAVAKTDLIDHVSKNEYYFNFKPKNNHKKPEKISKKTNIFLAPKLDLIN